MNASALHDEERRVQLARIQHPILRNLTASNDDLAARQRCVNLIVATLNEMFPAEFSRQPSDSPLDLAIPAMADLSDSTLGINPPYDQQSPFATSKVNLHEEDNNLHCRPAVRQKLADQTRMLKNLALASSGASCKVFWDLWDEVFVVLAEIVPLAELTAAHSGRMFTPNNDAASYIESAALLRLSKQEGSGLDEHFPRADSSSSSVLSQHNEPVSPSYGVAYRQASVDFGTSMFEFEADHGGPKNLRQQLLALDDTTLLPLLDDMM